MKFLTVSVLSAVLAVAAPMRAPLVVTIKVDGMKNSAMENMVENELKKIPGVEGVKVSKGTVQVAVANTGVFKLAALKQVLSDLTTNEKEPLSVNEETTTVTGAFQLYVTGISGTEASKLPEVLKGIKAIAKADSIQKAAPQGKAKGGRMEEGEPGSGVSLEVKGKVKIKELAEAVAGVGGSDSKPAIGNIIWSGPQAPKGGAALAVGGKGGKAAVPVNTTPVNSTCPVKAGRDVDSGITAVYQGKTYAFC